MHIFTPELLSAEPLSFEDLRLLIDARVLRALAQERDDPESDNPRIHARTDTDEESEA